ncbi:ABC transporter permease [Rhodobacterales bacterium 52_120_T64]|nr:ABC transporter permease [Rhodobacterales bacterium 52_120_T64]
MTDTGPVLAADGTPLKKKLAQALFVSRARAFSLVLPLLIFIVASFIIPIFSLMVQGVKNDTYSSNMPATTAIMAEWDGASELTEDMFAALVTDLIQARADKSIGRVATRVNREYAGTRSMFTKSARRAAKLEAPFMAAMLDIDEDWGDINVWGAMKVSSQTLSPAFYAAALDADYKADGSFVRLDTEDRIYVYLFVKTLAVALAVTLATLALGYPVAWLLASLPIRQSNLLMILVLLPFWTSLLVRTTAWIAMLQSHGVLNNVFVWLGITSDDSRFSLIYNMTGTIIAMTHILLPFMILPLFSVMKGIPPTYLRAAKSLGATNWTAFWRVYFPGTIPGIGAGALLVFILSIGYYITPALVGGQDGQLISNFIAYHMQKSLNWSLAAALGGILLVIVLAIYWVYDKVVGIDNMKMG